MHLNGLNTQHGKSNSYPEEMRQRLEDHGVHLFYNLFEIAPAALKLFRFNMATDGRVVDDAVC